jgi:hypothetical protein
MHAATVSIVAAGDFAPPAKLISHVVAQAANKGKPSRVSQPPAHFAQTINRGAERAYRGALKSGGSEKQPRLMNRLIDVCQN